MVFNSLHFVFFFVIVTTLYFLSPNRKRWILLLVASSYFYMSFAPVYILILGFTIGVDYLAGRLIENTTGPLRKAYLIASLFANISVLAVFKYYNFINANLSFLLEGFGASNHLPYLSMLLPIGLSFHTFQAMSYTIEVYRGHQKAERHLGIYALYVMFYPQLVAGPIERPQNLLPQFRATHTFDYDQVVGGLKLMLWGFFKKLVIADRLAIYVDGAYDYPMYHTGPTLLLATIFFAFQIYCDFSGYSDIAIGAAKVMGFKLMTNFNRPYLARSISEFWKRWHISLSTWFKDYLYIPLGGSRVKVSRLYFNILVVFVISGLWHGANWTFIVWGALNGIYMIVGLMTKRISDKLPFTIFKETPRLHHIFHSLVTFMLICFTWIFFRASSISDALLIVNKIFAFDGKLQFQNASLLIFSVFGVLFIILVEFCDEFYRKKISFFNNKSWIVRDLSYAFIVILILLIGVFDGGQFIYFQF